MPAYASRAIVGFCTNMPVERAYVLCKSAREVHDAGTTEIVLITNDPSRYWESLRPLGVSFCHTPCDYSRSTRRNEKRWKRLAIHAARMLGGSLLDRRLLGGSVARLRSTLWEAWCHPFVARWNGYARVLAERPYIEQVLFTDVKDVLIQSSCFAYLQGDQFQLFYEKPLDEEGWTGRWIRKGFGKASARAIAASGAQTICAGTTLGTRHAALKFLELVQGMFARYPFRTVDQGVINWLLFQEGDPDYITRVSNIVGAVTTVSSQSARDSIEIQNHVIVRKADQIACPIVHMWDRWPDLKSFVLHRYGMPQSINNSAAYLHAA